MSLFGAKKNKSISVKHISGLPVPDGQTCKVSIEDNKLQIEAGGNEYSLLFSQIVSVSFDMNVDIERYTKASKLTGAIGGLAFGTTGAIVGATPKTKTERKVTGCAVICFTSATNEEAYLVFEDTVPNSLEAAKLVDKLKPNIITKNRTIDL